MSSWKDEIFLAYPRAVLRRDLRAFHRVCDRVVHQIVLQTYHRHRASKRGRLDRHYSLALKIVVLHYRIEPEKSYGLLNGQSAAVTRLYGVGG